MASTVENHDMVPLRSGSGQDAVGTVLDIGRIQAWAKKDASVA